MSAMQRNKGQQGEREIAWILRELTGWDIRRRVRNHAGDSDLVGVPGWSCEVKRTATATRGQITAWWGQAVEQSRAEGLLPVLLYRRNMDCWRAVWPVSVHLAVQHADMWAEYSWAVEGSPEAWAAVAREYGGDKWI